MPTYSKAGSTLPPKAGPPESPSDRPGRSRVERAARGNEPRSIKQSGEVSAVNVLPEELLAALAAAAGSAPPGEESSEVRRPVLPHSAPVPHSGGAPKAESQVTVRRATLLAIHPDREKLYQLYSRLTEADFLVVCATDEAEARSSIARRAPEAVLLGPGVFEDLAELKALLRDARRGTRAPILRLDTGATGAAGDTGSAGGSAVRAFEAGADDFVAFEAPDVELVARLRNQIRKHRHLLALARRTSEVEAMLDLTRALASSLDFREILYTVVRRIASVVDVDRASIVLAPDGPEGEGVVVAASDDEGIKNLRIDLSRYPEIQEALRSGEVLTIEDARTHPVLEMVREDLPGEALRALALLPISWQEEPLGVLFLRSSRPETTLSEEELSFCSAVANATAVALRNAHVMASLRERTRQQSAARVQAEQRLGELERYANLFESAADGHMALSRDGRILFANPRAYEIGGVRSEEVRGKNAVALLCPEDMGYTRALWEDLLRGKKIPGALDMRVVRGGDGASRVLSCSFAELNEEEGAFLVSFRDVTEERELARELAKTKDFLESLIDSSPDGIIAADLRGTVLLFNKGAERIYGYKAQDVIGKVRVSSLYPKGGAREVMECLRSPQQGGVGKVKGARFDALGANGELIPITLSAAILYDENGRESATVGIFTDLREKLRVEERLAQAREDLAVSEQRAFIAQLAGTAAHELNQPLTSVIVYGQLLLRRLPKDNALHQAARSIVKQGERMAEIVRKIGEVTRYETKDYVGGAKILDLDRASGRRRSSLPPASLPPRGVAFERRGARAERERDEADAPDPEALNLESRGGEHEQGGGEEGA